MPVARRSAVVAAPPGEVWRTVGDPHHLPRWWPRVERVEGVYADGFTQVLRSDKGAQVRADFRVLERKRPARMRWTQEIANTPFERILESAETAVDLRAADGGTRVTVEVRQTLRGVSRLGGFMVRRATARQIDDALAALRALHG